MACALGLVGWGWSVVVCMALVGWGWSVRVCASRFVVLLGWSRDSFRRLFAGMGGLG